MPKRKCLNCNDSFYVDGVMKCRLTDKKVWSDKKCILGKEPIREKIACEGNPDYKGN